MWPGACCTQGFRLLQEILLLSEHGPGMDYVRYGRYNAILRLHCRLEYCKRAIVQMHVYFGWIVLATQIQLVIDVFRINETSQGEYEPFDVNVLAVDPILNQQYRAGLDIALDCPDTEHRELHEQIGEATSVHRGDTSQGGTKVFNAESQYYRSRVTKALP
jgi:hypothetical protein